MTVQLFTTWRLACCCGGVHGAGEAQLQPQVIDDALLLQFCHLQALQLLILGLQVLGDSTELLITSTYMTTVVL